MQNASTSTRPEVSNTHDARLTDIGVRSHQRSDRLSGLWYFRTREGKDVGPFRYRCEAETMLSRFIDEISHLQQSSMMPHKLHFRTCGVIGRRQVS